MICPTGSANFSTDLQSLHIVGRIKSGDTFTGLDLFLMPFTGKGTYNLGGNNISIGQYYLTADGNANNAYSTAGTALGIGKVVVNSYTNGVVNGTFEFTAANSNGGSKKVTNGSFSCRVTTL